MRLLVALLALLLLTGPATTVGATCSVDVPCRAGEGEYVMITPPNFDATRPTGILVFFHGFADTPRGILTNSKIAEVAAREGLVLVMPIGHDKRWYARVADGLPRDDVAFVRAVTADVASRMNVDRNLRVASGYSAGGFMTWFIACYAPDMFTAYLPVSGAFIEPIPDKGCPGGPVRLRHVHGTADTTVPMAGRRVNSGFRQADVRASIAVMAMTNHCMAPPEMTMDETEDCAAWTRACAPQSALALCTNGGGHNFDARHVAQGLAWVKALKPL